MADLRKLYGTNTKLENEGSKIDLGDGLSVTITRLKNPQFRKMYANLTKPYERQMRQNTLSEEIQNKILTQCLIETVVMNWSGLTLDDKEIPYSKENAYKILSDPELADFRDLIVDLAGDAQNFREELLEESEKNLQNGSDGKLNGDDTTKPSAE